MTYSEDRTQSAFKNRLLEEYCLLTALKLHEAEENYAVKSLMNCIPYQKHYCNEVKMLGTGRCAGVYIGQPWERKQMYGALAERGSLEDRGINGRIILK